MAEHSSLSVADLKDIQAGPVIDVPSRCIIYVFFSIEDVDKFRNLFRKLVLPHITTSDSARSKRDYALKTRAGSDSRSWTPFDALNVSFSQHGLEKLLPGADTADGAFAQGQFGRAGDLGDDKAKWLSEFTKNPIDGLFEITGYPPARVHKFVERNIKPLRDSHSAITIRFLHIGEVRPGEQKGHEHFGFNDGISQPFVKFEDDAERKRKELPGQFIVNPGVLVVGQPGDELAEKRPWWAKNGSFLVYRHLKQLVPEFNAFLRDAVLRSIFVPPRLPGSTDAEELEKRINFLGARLMGRWKSGLPVVFSEMEGGEIPVDDPIIGKDPKVNNKFDYGPREEKPRTQRLCPFAAHVRRTTPRTDIPKEPGEKHMILRGGIAFGPELTSEEEHKTVEQRGLSFVCYQSSVEAGFEFIQKKWSNNEKFMDQHDGVIPGIDPIIGKNKAHPKMTGFDAEDVSKELTIPMEFVVPQGGEYFFQPSMAALHHFVREPSSESAGK